MTVSESLLQITELTKQNLQILQMLNDSFYTKANHLSTTVGDTTYVIPSYIALENKINHVQDAINNLVHAAKSGEAWFNFDGNSKEICVRGYQSSPNPIHMTPKKYFETETRTFFKDMLSPQPFLNFDMADLPDDINQVVVKKFIPYSQELKNRIFAFVDVSNTECASLSWADLNACLVSGNNAYVPGRDYLEYETVYSLPIRNCTRSGTYVIEDVITDQITENLENVIEVRIHKGTPLTRTEFDGVMITDLSAGDILTTYDGSAKMRIETINPNTRILKLLVLSGEYVNPMGAGNVQETGDDLIKSVSDYTILKLFSSTEGKRELHIPLEEDQYVYITAAPINPRLNIQSEWGTGLFINADNLHMLTSPDTPFRDYYNQNVSNLGDSLVELATISFPSVTKYNDGEIQIMTNMPNVGLVKTDVVQINKHLNDSDTVKNIRSLYSQKKQYQIDLEEVQGKITALQSQLSEISFDDMSGTRSAYTAQISDLKNQQNNLVTSINKIIDSISISANNSEVPIENAKFRVRGYVDVNQFITNLISDFSYAGSNVSKETLQNSILGIKIRYRYRNTDIPQANVAVIGDNFLFTEWTEYTPPYRERHMRYFDGTYDCGFDDIKDDAFNYSDNVPKFNQIDIPITQGENVEFQYKIIWGFGYPFATVATEWSDNIVVEFPAELTTDVQVVTIIEENNSDIERYRFENILNNGGITKHIDDAIDDQDIKYFHKAESIASGFYTDERRIIPLKDKLLDIHSKLVAIEDMIEGNYANALSVSCIVDGLRVIVQPDTENIIHLPAYSMVFGENDANNYSGSAIMADGCVNVGLQIVLSNPTSHTVNLFPLFPASRSVTIDELTEANCKFTKDDFTGVQILNTVEFENDGVKTAAYTLNDQIGNQIITYRGRNPYNAAEYNSKQLEYKYLDEHVDQFKLMVWPTIQSKYDICINSDVTNAKYILAPGESRAFNLAAKYRVKQEPCTYIIAFDVRNSLYNDPLHYEIKFVAKYNQSTEDALQSSKISFGELTKYNITVR